MKIGRFLKKWFKQIPRRIHILSLSILILGAGIFLVTDFFKQQAGDLLFPDFNAEDVSQIKITKADGDNWELSGVSEADSEPVSTMLNEVSDLRRELVVSRNPDKRALFGVDSSNGIEVILFDNNKSELVHFFIGNVTSTHTGQYLRVEGDDDVIQYGKIIFEHFDRDFALDRLNVF